MKNKRLLVLFIALLFVVAVVILNGTLFTVKNITVILDGTRETPEVLDDAEVKRAVTEDVLNKNIFFLSDKKITAAACKNPYVYFISAQRHFPDSLTVRVAERKEALAVKIEGEFYMLDRYGQVLNKSALNVNNLDGKLNVEVTGLTTPFAAVGQALHAGAGEVAALTELIGFFYQIQTASVTTAAAVRIRKDYIKNITFFGGDLIVKTIRNRDDTVEESHTVKISGYASDLAAKFRAAWGVHEANLDILTGTIEVGDEKNQKGEYEPVWRP